MGALQLEVKEKVYSLRGKPPLKTKAAADARSLRFVPMDFDHTLELLKKMMITLGERGISSALCIKNERTRTIAWTASHHWRDAFRETCMPLLQSIEIPDDDEDDVTTLNQPEAEATPAEVVADIDMSKVEPPAAEVEPNEAPTG